MTTPQTNNGGPAFPEGASGPYPNGEIVLGREGMTLRVWLAGKAMAGLLSSWSSPGSEFFEAANVAKFAYAYADAMIAAREETK